MKIITVPIVCGKIPDVLGAVCYEGDKNVCRLEFTGAEPNLDYKLDLRRADGTKNVLDLVNSKGILMLEADALSAVPSGWYEVQLRTVGDTVLHSNVATLTVMDSINALEAFPETIPTELEQLEQRITEAAKHPPMPGADGTWLLWQDGAYAPSDVPVQEHPVFVAEYGVTTYGELEQAWKAGKLLFCRDGEHFAFLYRHRQGVYFSFRSVRPTDIDTKFCLTNNSWKTESTGILVEELAALEQRIRALEGKK